MAWQRANGNLKKILGKPTYIGNFVEDEKVNVNEFIKRESKGKANIAVKQILDIK